MYAMLSEVSSLTGMLAEALDRGDQDAFRMVLTMRQEPLNRLREADGNLRSALLELDEADAVRAAELLNGAAGEAPPERQLASQAAANRRLLERLLEQDARISRRVGGGKSLYRTLREEPGAPARPAPDE